MDVHELVNTIKEFGYVGLFFCLWLGIAGMPIPDEMVVMSGGFVSSLGILHAVPAFLLTYLGVVSGLSLGYFLGKWFGASVLHKLISKKKAAYLTRSQTIFQQYGNTALIISYFIPVVRHIVPYLAGISMIKFRTYALYSYSTGFVWTLFYFMLGSFFGENIEVMVKTATTYGILMGAAVLVIASLCYLLKRYNVPAAKESR